MCLVCIISSHYHLYLNDIKTFSSYGPSLDLVSVLIFIISTMWLSVVYVLRGIFKGGINEVRKFYQVSLWREESNTFVL